MRKAKAIGALGRLDALLNQHRVAYASVTGPLLEKLRRSPGSDLDGELREEVRALFGGMGSLTDVYICRLNGDVVVDEEEANRRLEELRRDLWAVIDD